MTARDFALSREDIVAAALTCLTGAAVIPAMTGYSTTPLCMWLVGATVWACMKGAKK